MDFYIYRLVDPGSGEPFYIGKGRRGRINRHEEEARAGKRSHKCNKIRSIWANGGKVKKEIVGRFVNELDAYKAEAKLIQSIGLGNLTNVMPGGGGAVSLMRPSKITKEMARGLTKMAVVVGRGLKVSVFGRDLTDDVTKCFFNLVDLYGPKAIEDAVRPLGVSLTIQQPSVASNAV